MPQVGETRRTKWQTEVWAICEKCNSPRWVGVRHGQPRSRCCKHCRPDTMSKEVRHEHDQEYRRRYYKENIESINRKRRNYKMLHPERYAEIRRINSRKGRWRLRAKVMALLGNKCANCGFDDIRALQLDHIHGNGCEERKSLNNQAYSIYKRALEVGRKEYQILCANCNWIKAHEELKWQAPKM